MSSIVLSYFQPPAKPLPYKKSPSPSPNPITSGEAPSNIDSSPVKQVTPPPVPIKKRPSMYNYTRVNPGIGGSVPQKSSHTDLPLLATSAVGQGKGPVTNDANWKGFHSYVEIDLPEMNPSVRPRPRPTPRERSHTISDSRKIQNYQNSMCVAVNECL